MQYEIFDEEWYVGEWFVCCVFEWLVEGFDDCVDFWVDVCGGGFCCLYCFVGVDMVGVDFGGQVGCVVMYVFFDIYGCFFVFVGGDGCCDGWDCGEVILLKFVKKLFEIVQMNDGNVWQECGEQWEKVVCLCECVVIVEYVDQFVFCGYVQFYVYVVQMMLCCCWCDVEVFCDVFVCVVVVEDVCDCQFVWVQYGVDVGCLCVYQYVIVELFVVQLDMCV